MNEDGIGDGIDDAAARWHAAQGDDDMDWTAFTAWLEADPRHRAAFDAVALIDDAVDRHRDTLRRLVPDAHTDVAPTPDGGRWRWGIAGAAAAAIAATVAFVVAPRETAAPTTIAAEWRAQGTAREVRLADARVTLAPGSRLASSAGDAARLTLVGRAVFDVRHDPARTLSVEAAGYEIRDVGTRFEVMAGAGIVRVVVAEGEVAVRALAGTAAAVRVTAGRTATGTADGRIVTAVAGGAVADGLRAGPLRYDAVPLGLVAADLARATGSPVVAEPRIAARPFSGVLAPGDAATMTATLATLAGLEARRRGDAIQLRDPSPR